MRAVPHAHGLRSVSLRYFNAAGAHEDGHIGERHEPETHLIPNVLKAALGEAPAIRVFGTDYDTPDGTAVRDYVHVMDLVDAHWLALAWLDEHDGAAAFNLGSATGFSVRKVIRAAETVVGRPIPVEHLRQHLSKAYMSRLGGAGWRLRISAFLEPRFRV